MFLIVYQIFIFCLFLVAVFHPLIYTFFRTESASKKNLILISQFFQYSKEISWRRRATSPVTSGAG